MKNGVWGLCILARPCHCISNRRRASPDRSLLLFCALFLLLLCTSCSRIGGKTPSIEFTRVPPADRGGPDFLDTIEGRVKGAKPQQKIVVFTHNNVWWVQPGRNEPYTAIKPDSTWSSSTHVGMEYAALLVDPSYQPPAAMDALPAVGAGVVAIATVPGDPSKHVQRHVVQFSGYEWVPAQLPAIAAVNAITIRRMCGPMRMARFT